MDDWFGRVEMGIPCVDSDHRILLRLLNHLEGALTDREDVSVVGSILDSLTEYTHYHFDREERLMELAGFPGLGEHRRMHRRLAGEVGAYLADLRAAPESFDAHGLRDFVQGWLIDHIQGDDFAYQEACLARPDAMAEVAALRLTDGIGVGLDLDWSRLRVLLVEDNPNFRRLVETLFSVGGLRGVRTAGSAEEGLDSLMSHPADVIVCDLVMDHMDGVAMAREAFKIDPLTRFVFVSGLDGDTLRRRASSIGVDAAIEKPITATSLFGAVAKALEGAVRHA